jgi:hypothetical protein
LVKDLKMEMYVKTIPHSEQRYPTVGDYWWDDNDVLQVRVSDMKNSLYETMVIVHEIIEEALTRYRGLSEDKIMKFDLAYEKKRAKGLVPENSEPGFAENCPYKNEHTFATSVEIGMCAMAGIDFNKYDETVNSL